MSIDEKLAGEIMFESKPLILSYLKENKFSQAREYVSNLMSRLRRQELYCLGVIYNDFLENVSSLNILINQAESNYHHPKQKIYIGNFKNINNERTAV